LVANCQWTGWPSIESPLAGGRREVSCIGRRPGRDRLRILVA
jgi:hypothetical protein